MIVNISDPYIGTFSIDVRHLEELYVMACDYTRQRGNTFHFIKRYVEENYPTIKERYATDR